MLNVYVIVHAKRDHKLAQMVYELTLDFEFTIQFEPSMQI